MSDLEREVMRQRLLTLAAQQRGATPEEIAAHFGPGMRNATDEERARLAPGLMDIHHGTRPYGPSLPPPRGIIGRLLARLFGI